MTEIDDRAAADAPQPARKIILLSDGTGNSAAKLNKTNVWALYQALDLGGDDQIAFYDDGVGTSGFRPFRLLGGALGWGLSRNIRDLYEFLCRHYRAGDQIYIFGFSRGAFTARTLAGLIARCGVLDCSKPVPNRRGKRLQLNTREGLKAGVELAYQSYRRGYQAPVATLFRRLRDLVLTAVPEPDEFRRQYSLAGSSTVKLIGVWDTVDAVGLPIDELSTMIDRIFYPHRFPDQDLSAQVERACHAIAIDDERHSFHPVLWNEKGTADSERISQVWFAGMHSNVGGGYPDDDLAFVPLRWMIIEAQAKGLRFDPDSLRDIHHRVQPLGKMYDSRRGVGVYYRYNPRDVRSLCADADNGVQIAEPKIHEAVFERIAENTAGYAPAGLPTTYRVVDRSGAVSAPDPTTYESAGERDQRAALLKRAQHHVFWRRVLYYLFVAVTVALVLMPWYRPAIPGAEPDGRLETLLSSLLGWLPAVLPGFLSASAGWWTEAWTQSACLFLVLVALYCALLWHSRTVDGNIHRLSEIAWWHVKRCPKPKPPIPDAGRFERLAASLNRVEWLNRLRRFWIKWLVPGLTMVAIVGIALGAIYRFAAHNPTIGDGICNQQPPAPPNDGSRPITVDPRLPCVETGMVLTAGRKYHFKVATSDWQDNGLDADLSGLAHRSDRVRLAPAIPARRHLTLPWYALVAEIGRESGDAFPISRESFVVTPARGGKLYLYVNDAIDALGTDRYAYYRNNQGTAIVTVTPLDH